MIKANDKTYTVAGIVAEFNPFHNGHRYLIDEARRQTGCDYVIVIMSGNFVQDGTPAVVDKYTRTKMALFGGADYVLELPVFDATASAETFAFGAVSSLVSTGVVDYLCFGAEHVDVPSFLSIASCLISEPTIYRNTLKEELKKGLSFPKARQLAVCEYMKSQNVDVNSINAILEQPNDILGIEYCKALLVLSSFVMPVAIKRQFVEHGKVEETNGAFASATTIRDLIYQGKAEWEAYVPLRCRDTLKDALIKSKPMHPDCLVPLIKNRQLSLLYETHAGFDPKTSIDDASEELIHAFLKADLSVSGYDEIIRKLKTKNITQTRIQRALLHMLLNIAPHERFRMPSYLRLLGFRMSCEPLRQAIKKHLQDTGLPMITKVADHKELMDENAVKLFELNLYADALYEMLRDPQGRYLKKEFIAGPVRV